MAVVSSEFKAVRYYRQRCSPKTGEGFCWNLNPHPQDSNLAFFRDPKNRRIFREHVLEPHTSTDPLKVHIGNSKDGRDVFCFLTSFWKERRLLDISASDPIPRTEETMPQMNHYLKGAGALFQKFKKLKEIQSCELPVRCTIQNGFEVVQFAKQLKEIAPSFVHDFQKSPLAEQQDVLFLEHVLIELSEEKQVVVIENAKKSLKPGGLLFLESSPISLQSIPCAREIPGVEQKFERLSKAYTKLQKVLKEMSLEPISTTTREDQIEDDRGHYGNVFQLAA